MFRLPLVFAIGASNILVAASINGSWTGTMSTNGSKIPILLKLAVEEIPQEAPHSAGKVSGTVATGDGTRPVPIEDATFTNDELSFEVHDNANRLVRFRLTLNGGALTGEARVGDQVSQVSLSISPGGVSVTFGSGSGDRVGSSVGSGAGSGEGFGNGVYRVGGGVSAPVLLHKVDPEYTEEARAAKYEGTVVLYVEIDPTGTPTNIKVERGLWLDLDAKAIEAVKHWKFKPGQKDGKPVTVAATIELNFRL